MGDKPEINVPDASACYIGPWNPANNPSRIPIYVAGWTRNPALPPEYPPAPEGPYWLNFLGCEHYNMPYENFGMNINIFPTYASWNFRSPNGTVLWRRIFEWTDDLLYMSSDYEIPNVYNGGTVSIIVPYGGTVQPFSWLPAKLLNIPEQDGYFAEQGQSGLDNKNFRYANEANGTNLKMILE